VRKSKNPKQDTPFDSWAFQIPALDTGFLPAPFLPRTFLAGLLVVFMGTHLSLHAASLNEFFEPEQSHTDRFTFMHSHPQCHEVFFGD
jgi:hypothetical protein